MSGAPDRAPRRGASPARARAGARAGGGLALVALLLAAGCSSVPVGPPAGEGAPPVPAPHAPRPPDPRDVEAWPGRPGAAPPAARAPAPRAPRCGACYLDDGPGDRPPTDLDAIPDAVPRAEPLHPAANRPYVVFGRGYVPRTDLASHRERGVASWYGRKFHGRRTSSGEIYDMYAMTAAHPTLPIPSFVRVTHARSGRSVVVRVNDRGPFLHRRVIDLSYAAAWRLGFVNAGSAEVEVELLSPLAPPRDPSLQTAVRSDVAERDAPAAAPAEAAPIERLTVETTVDERPAAGAPASDDATPEPRSSLEPPALAAAARHAVDASPAAADAAPAPRGTWLQLGAFSSRANADAARARVERELAWLPLPLEVVAHDGLWRVQAGPWASADDARAVADRIAAGGAQPRPIAVAR